MRTRALHSHGPARDVRFCLVFPRETVSIPAVRRVLGDALGRLGIEPDDISDLLLAVTEACTNVLRHAGPGRRYEVVVQVGRNRCILQVLDSGRGIDPSRLRARRTHLRRPPVRPGTLLRRRPRDIEIAQLAESGRGMAIMRACVDDVTLRTGPGRGTVVSLRKRIEWRADAPLHRLPSSALEDAV